MTVSTNSTAEHSIEVRKGKRFRFGENWRLFLKVINDERIAEAEKSLREFLELDRLDDRTFLDIGCGSGLFSLAAHRLGAMVRSFDYDPQSVACAEELKRRYLPNNDSWTIEVASVLDCEYLDTLGQFDIVYAWGVLHHTGDMWRALELVKTLVKPGGRLFVAIYNDAGKFSRTWLKIKRLYCVLPASLGLPFAIGIWTPIEVYTFIRYCRVGKPGAYFDLYRDYKKSRGMSRWHDMIDWIGGYPYEFAKAEDLVAFYTKDGFRVMKMLENKGYGNHQIVFAKNA